MGLLTLAYAPARDDLERATGLFRLFREQPTAELARAATAGLRRRAVAQRAAAAALPPVDQLRDRAAVRARQRRHRDQTAASWPRAYTSPITLGIILGYVVGKPVGIIGISWLVTKLSRGPLRPPVGWAAVAGGGAIAGIGFTVSLLIATLAFVRATRCRRPSSAS